MKTLYTNAHILSPGVDLPNASVLEEEGIVVQVYPPSMALPQFDEAIDCNGHLLLPGFFDIHACLPKGKDIPTPRMCSASIWPDRTRIRISWK